MKLRLPALRLPRLRLTAALLLGGACLFSQFVVSGQSQAPTPVDPRVLAAVTALATQLKAQQDEMIANQTKIETQTAALAEELRQVKIYSARGGGSLRH